MPNSSSVARVCEIASIASSSPSVPSTNGALLLSHEANAFTSLGFGSKTMGTVATRGWYSALRSRRAPSRRRAPRPATRPSRRAGPAGVAPRSGASPGPAEPVGQEEPEPAPGPRTGRPSAREVLQVGSSRRPGAGMATARRHPGPASAPPGAAVRSPAGIRAGGRGRLPERARAQAVAEGSCSLEKGLTLLAVLARAGSVGASGTTRAQQFLEGWPMRWDESHESRDVIDRRGEQGPSQAGGGLGGLLFLVPWLMRSRIGRVILVGAVLFFIGRAVLGRRRLARPERSHVAADGHDSPRPPRCTSSRSCSTTCRPAGPATSSSASAFPIATRSSFSTRTPHRRAAASGDAATGPFYCPNDERVYIDLGFFHALSDKLGARGQFAQAYVVAHEMGHHVQKLLGITQRVDGMRVTPKGRRRASVRLELQADCFAGIWAHSTAAARTCSRPGTSSPAIEAAAAVGDDWLQKQATGTVSPESLDARLLRGAHALVSSRGYDTGSVPVVRHLLGQAALIPSANAPACRGSGNAIPRLGPGRVRPFDHPGRRGHAAIVRDAPVAERATRRLPAASPLRARGPRPVRGEVRLTPTAGSPVSRGPTRATT